MSLDGDREKTITAMIVARAWRDAGFRQSLLREPKKVLADEGLILPDAVDVKIVAETAAARYINLARDTTDAKQALDLFQSVVPVPEGLEIRLVQSTERTRYFVLPVVPAGIEPTVASEAELNRLAGERTAVSFYFVEAEAVGTTTGVVAEAEVAVVVVLT